MFRSHFNLASKKMIRISAICLIAFFISGCAGKLPIKSSTNSLMESGLGNSGPATTDAAIEIQTEQPPQLDNIDDFIAYALEHNPKIKAAYEKWKSALEAVPQVTSFPEPRLTWVYFIEELQTRTGPQTNRVSISQILPWFGKLDLRGQIAGSEAVGQLWQIESASLAVIREVKRTYYEYAFLAHDIRIGEENLEILQGLEPVVQRRIQVGSSQSDLLRLQIEIGKTELKLDQLRDLRPSMSAQLAAALNLDQSALLPFGTLPETIESDLDEDFLRKQMNENNPGIHSITTQIAGAQHRQDLAKKDRYPDVTLGIDYFMTDNAIAPGVSDSGVDPYAFNLSVNVPIRFRKYAASVRQAEFEEASLAHSLTQKRNQLDSDLAVSLYHLANAERETSFTRDALIPRAKQNLEVTLGSYRAGAASILDLIDSQQELLIFERSYWRSIADIYKTLADIEALCGGILK